MHRSILMQNELGWLLMVDPYYFPAIMNSIMINLNQNKRKSASPKIQKKKKGGRDQCPGFELMISPGSVRYTCYRYSIYFIKKITGSPSISLKIGGNIDGPPVNNEVRNQRNRWSTCNRFTWQIQD